MTVSIEVLGKYMEREAFVHFEVSLYPEFSQLIKIGIMS